MPEDTIADVAERIDRCGDRFHNAGDEQSEAAARESAQAVRECGSVEVALRIERAFLLACGVLDKAAIPPPKPRVGLHEPAGKRYVSYGESIRVGGTRGWRNNNPGYIPCSDRAVYYGALGCDGYYAIFPDEDVGRAAIVPWMREHYPDRSVHDALKEMLPADEAGPDAVDQVEKQCGIDPTTKTEDLDDDQLDALTGALLAGPSWTAGESYDVNVGTAPDWVESIWEQQEAADAAEAEGAEAASAIDAADIAPSDNS
jgi:hypothetical protein